MNLTLSARRYVASEHAHVRAEFLVGDSGMICSRLLDPRANVLRLM